MGGLNDVSVHCMFCGRELGSLATQCDNDECVTLRNMVAGPTEVCRICDNTGLRDRVATRYVDGEMVVDVQTNWPCECRAGLRVIALRVMKSEVEHV